MGWIRERILSENKKHYRVTGGLDWARLAEAKILSNFRKQIMEIDTYNAIGEDDCVLLNDLHSLFVQSTHNLKNGKVCGNSNMRDLTDEDRNNGRSHSCTEDDPCDQCSPFHGNQSKEGGDGK